jgi:hypothetical protein
VFGRDTWNEAHTAVLLLRASPIDALTTGKFRDKGLRDPLCSRLQAKERHAKLPWRLLLGLDLLLLLNHRLSRTLPLGSLGVKHPLRSHVDKTSSDAGVGDQAGLRQTPPGTASVLHYIHDGSVVQVRDTSRPPANAKGFRRFPDSFNLPRKIRPLLLFSDTLV